MFEHSAIGMGLLSLDRRILQVNPATCRMSGYSQAELLAINPAELSHPDDRGLDAGLFRELVAGERETYAFERRYVRKDGTYFWGRLNYSLVRSADGAPQYIFGTLENIDAQHAALAELTESEARSHQTGRGQPRGGRGPGDTEEVGMRNL
jgi:PAS domain S-box-containing protein